MKNRVTETSGSVKIKGLGVESLDCAFFSITKPHGTHSVCINMQSYSFNTHLQCSC